MLHEKLGRDDGLGRLSGRSLLEQDGDALGELGAVADPIVDAIALQVNGRGVGAGVVGSDNFDRTAVAGAVLFNHNDAVVGLFARSNTRETDHQHFGHYLSEQLVVRVAAIDRGLLRMPQRGVITGLASSWRRRQHLSIAGFRRIRK